MHFVLCAHFTKKEVTKETSNQFQRLPDKSPTNEWLQHHTLQHQEYRGHSWPEKEGKNKILGKSQTQTTWVSLHSCFFCDFSRTVQNSHCGLAPKGCCCHRENEDEDLSFTRTMIWCVTSQTASKPLYQQLQKAARTLGYNLTVLITEDQSKVEISAAVYHLGWHQTWGSMEDQHQPGLGHYFGLAV